MHNALQERTVWYSETHQNCTAIQDPHATGACTENRKQKILNRRWKKTVEKMVIEVG